MNESVLHGIAIGIGLVSLVLGAFIVWCLIKSYLDKDDDDPLDDDKDLESYDDSEVIES